MEELNALIGLFKFILVLFSIDCIIMLSLDEEAREYIWRSGHWK